jgi:hypothetical protein
MSSRRDLILRAVLLIAIAALVIGAVAVGVVVGVNAAEPLEGPDE